MTYHPHWIYIDHRMLIMFFYNIISFSPHVTWSVSMSCGHLDLKLEYVVSSGVNILGHNITFKGH